ncbi:hypothetical protein JCM3766R1_005566 [Sporobolomyces carnicolor]
MSKHLPRRRKTLPYPSPPSSIDSVSSCDSFSSSSSSSYGEQREPTFTSEFSFEPRGEHDHDASWDEFPPPTAQFFPAASSRSRSASTTPRKFTKREEWQLWYSANFATNLLEPWENILIHLLFLSILALSYVALSRVFALSTLTRLATRLRFYVTGGGGGSAIHLVESASLI